jgi:PAS domain S-box-containing protein
MISEHLRDRDPTSQRSGLISGRFLNAFFDSLERAEIPALGLLGDLPIPLSALGRIRGPVEWNYFAEFLRRLEQRVGGPAGLEACGEMIGQSPAYSGAIPRLAGFAFSPYSLYRAVGRWGLPRVFPGIDIRLTRVDERHIEIVARLADGLKPCPQIFHVAIGGARILPRLIGLTDAVVSSSIGDREARYQVATPSSQNGIARFKQRCLMVFRAKSILHDLEEKRRELHARDEALQSANEALAQSQRQFRSITEAAVDVLCEIDESGRIAYVTDSIHDLTGYTREQVTGSHYRLWIPGDHHTRVNQAFDQMISGPCDRAFRGPLQLYNDQHDIVQTEMTARACVAVDGDRRIVCILRDGRATTEVAAPQHTPPGNTFSPPHPAEDQIAT